MKHIRAFTLLELLIVIAIITVLAGLTIQVLGHVNRSAGIHRAKTEIAAIETALENFKTDNGDYPRCSETDLLDASQHGGDNSLAISGSGVVPARSGSASLTLYVNLSGDTGLRGVTGTNARVYMNFKSNMLYPRTPAGTARTSDISAVIDPFRDVYGYSTIGSSTSALATPSTPKGYNPTFDLWSEGGAVQYGVSGTASWISNW